MSQETNQVKNKSTNENLEKVWNGVYQEFTNYRSRTLGKILTIIDAVIVDTKQNKSVKNLITNTVWENDGNEVNMAKWLIWLDNTTTILEDKDQDESVPMKYVNIPVGSLDGYR